MSLIVECSVCLHERGEAPNPEATHGYCPQHFAEVLAQVRARWGRPTEGPGGPGKSPKRRPPAEPPGRAEVR
jgi:hypothetical protein